jgi:hypothetical protein
MKYTNSIDGKKRCTIRLMMRLTQEEYKNIAKLAKASDRKSVREYLSFSLLDSEYLYNIMQEGKRMLGIIEK